MGDLIQKLMEEMIPELDDLQAKGLFSPTEIKTIVKRRTDFEYRIKAKIPNLDDFLRYIQYEVNLERLRVKRKSKLASAQTPSASDVTSTRRVSFIFDRALRKFGDNVGLWEQYIEFCRRTGSSRALNKVFPKALALHPLCASLWIKHARWEFDDNQNAHGARTILQRALRVLPESEELWVYFFQMELQYIAKLRERKRVLGLLVLKPDQSEQEKANEEEESGDILKLSREEKDLLDEKDKSFLSGALPLAIYRNAIAVPRLSKNFAFRLQLVNSLPEFYASSSSTPSSSLLLTSESSSTSLPLADDSSSSSSVVQALRTPEKAFREMCNDLAPLKNALWESIFADFSKLEECWEAQAMKVLKQTSISGGDSSKGGSSSQSKGKHLLEAIGVFDEAVKSVSTPKMWFLYAKFIEQLLSTTQESKISSHLRDLLMAVCNRAEEAKATSEDLFALWVGTLLRSQKEEAETVLERGLLAFPKSVTLWRVLLEISSLKLSENQTNSTTRGKRKAVTLEKLDNEEQELNTEEKKLWKRVCASGVETAQVEALELLLQLAAARADYVLPHSLFREAITSAQDSQLKCRYVDWNVQTTLATLSDPVETSNTIRQVISWVLSFPGPSLALFDRCLEAERRCPFKDHQRVKQLLERSLSAFPTEVSLWLQYLQEETGRDLEAVYWRARKALPSSDQDRLSVEYARAIQ